jgi:hypothetical protein
MSVVSLENSMLTSINPSWYSFAPNVPSGFNVAAKNFLLPVSYNWLAFVDMVVSPFNRI